MEVVPRDAVGGVHELDRGRSPCRRRVPSSPAGGAASGSGAGGAGAVQQSNGLRRGLRRQGLRRAKEVKGELGMRKLWLMLLLVAALAAAAHAAAQTVTGTIQGTATDSSGAVLPGVTITVRHVDTGQERTVVTNSTGFYTAPFVPIGRYRVTAVLSGFGTIVRENIQVGLNETQVVDFRLDPRMTSAVTVTAESPAVNTTSAEVKGSLTAEQIEDKPTLNPGTFLGLAETFTGFQENPTSGQNNPTASSGSSINFNGTGTRGATFQINGVNNDDSSENQHR